MTDYKINAESGKYAITGSDAGGTVKRSAESWQFFAFMFAATATFAFALIDEIGVWEGRLALKFLSFFALAYVILWNRRSRNLQVRLLGIWKEEHYS